MNKKTAIISNDNADDKVKLRCSKNNNKDESNINIIESKNKFTNLVIQKLDINKTDNGPNNYIILEDKKRK